jgi:hydroxypyruvate isomerase
VPRFAANLSLLFTDLPFPERFAAAAACGFAGVEFQFPYAFPAPEVRGRLDAAKLVPVLFNVSPGDAAAGDRGLAALPGREAEFRAVFDQALDYAAIIGCPRLHVMAGLTAATAETEATYVANLRHAADLAVARNVTLLIEPLNAGDNPGYFLRTTRQAVAVLERVERANVKLQFDFYHCQITEGDLAHHARDLLPHYAHVQVANVPGRHEPDRGEINYPFLFDLLDEIGYAGWVGCEYKPAGDTAAGLGWARRWGIGAR